MTIKAGETSDLYWLSATEAVNLMRAGDLTATDLVEACLARIEALEDRIKAWAFLDPELPLAVAGEIDARRVRGEDISPLQGIPLGVKDVFNTLNMPTQMGSSLWEGFTPGNDSRAVANLRRQGVIVMGKTVTAEFAVHHPGPTVNPYDFMRSPGTSSSGSAVAVATGMTPIALGTQTAGSTIRPASYCGVYGLKPTFGLIPRTGILKTVDTLDHVTVHARTLEDIRLVFDNIRVRGTNYPVVNRKIDSPEALTLGRPPWRVGLVRGPKWSYAEKYAQDAILNFASEIDRIDGIEVKELELPDIFSRAHEVHDIIYSRMLSYYFEEESKQFDKLSKVFQEMIVRGNRFTLKDYREGLAFQDDLVDTTERMFDDVDVILNLSSGGEAMVGLETPDRPDNCLIWTFARVPALGVPAFQGPLKLPFGAQLVARRYDDYGLMEFADLLAQKGVIGQGPYPDLPIIE